MKNIIIASAALFLFVLPLSAQDDNIVNGNKLESWYTYWALGYGPSQYSNELQDFLDWLEDQEGVTRAEIALDMLGFYFPVNEHHTAVGFVIDAIADGFEVEGESFQINQYTYAASVMHFFNGTIGKGFYLRGDLGFAYFNVESSIEDYSATSDSGIGLLAGTGYGFNIGSGTRIMLDLAYSYRSVEGDAISSFGLKAGFMF